VKIKTAAAVLAMKVFEDEEEVTLGTLPDPAELDDETLDIWQLSTESLSVRPEISESNEAQLIYHNWEKALNAAWEARGGMDLPTGQAAAIEDAVKEKNALRRLHG
jgi:hypothetical protein